MTFIELAVAEYPEVVSPYSTERARSGLELTLCTLPYTEDLYRTFLS